MGVGRAAPDSQVPSDFEKSSCPWRAASTYQGNLMVLFLGKRHRDFSVRISFELRFCCFARFCCFPEILLFPRDFAVSQRFCCFPEVLLFRDSNRNISAEVFAVSQRFCCFEIRTETCLCLYPKRGPYKLLWSAEAALQGQLITSKSGRTWLPGAALLTPILKGATLTSTFRTSSVFIYSHLQWHSECIWQGWCCVCMATQNCDRRIYRYDTI